MSIRVSIAGVAACASMFAASANAADASGPYLGGGMGKSSTEISSAEFNEKASAYRAFGGYAFGDYLAVEAEYLNGGKSSKDFGGNALAVSSSGYIASVLFRARTGGSLALYGKVGYALYKVNSTSSVGGVLSPSTTDSSHTFAYGIGASYTFSQKYLIRLEYEAVDLTKGNFNVATFGVGYKF
jgi:OmpA-OmpF porin, OOP family